MPEPIVFKVESVSASELQSAQAVLYRTTGHVVPAQRKPSFGRGVIGWVIFVGVAVLLFLYLQSQNKTPAPPPKSDASWTPASILVAAGYLWFVLIWFVLIRWLRTRQSVRPETYRFSDEGVEVVSDCGTTRWRWHAFDTAAELDDVFVLRWSIASGLVVPKRAAGSEANVDAIRVLLQTHLPAPVLPAHSAFEVVR